MSPTEQDTQALEYIRQLCQDHINSLPVSSRGPVNHAASSALGHLKMRVENVQQMEADKVAKDVIKAGKK